MPTYKQRPHVGKKKAELPLYRPMDRLAARAVENRRMIVPAVAGTLLLLALFGAFKAYSYYYENKASTLYNRGELEVLAKEYGRSRSAKIARMKLGRMSLEAQEYDRAREWYEPVAADAHAPAMVRVAAQQNLALAYLKNGNHEKAADWLRKAARDPENAGNDYTELLLARVEEVSGHEDKALEIYRTLAEGSNDRDVKIEAEERRKWLESPSQ